MTRPHSIPVVAEQWMTAWNSKSPQAMVALFTEDGIYEDLAFQVASVGHKSIAGWISVGTDHMPDIRIDITDAFQSDERVALRWTFTATPTFLGPVRSTGQRFSVPAASIFEMREGRIAKVQDYYNLADILRQLKLPSGPYMPSHLENAK